MIAKIYFEDHENDFIIDCIALGVKFENKMKITYVLHIGKDDNYLEDRPVTRLGNEFDCFYMPLKTIDVFSKEAEDKIKEENPEYFL